MKPRRADKPPKNQCATAQLRAADLAQLDMCLKRHWKRYRKALKRAQKKFSEDPVHECRVEARRLLALTDLLLPLLRDGTVERIEDLVKRHLDASDGLRDTQVQLLEVGQLQKEVPGFRQFAAHLRKREQRLTKKTRRNLRNARTGKLQRLIDCCRKDLNKELKKHSAQELCTRLMKPVERSFARTRKFLAQVDPHDTETIHRTRVSFKKFRYMAEAVTELLSSVDAQYLARLREYQALMGAIQDRSVLIESFSRWILKAQPKTDWASSAQTQLKAGMRKLVKSYLAQADRLLDFWPLPLQKPHNSAGPARAARKNSRRR